MTREEIENSKTYRVSKAALDYYNEHHQDKNIDLTDAFEAGAKWADETMIEKAREWVKNAFTGPFGEGLANNIADEFVKAMKGVNHGKDNNKEL